MNYDVLVEKLMSVYAKGSFSEEVLEAKREFFNRAGILDEMSGDFEMKMAQFVDWYLFSRSLKNPGQTPLEMALFQDDQQEKEKSGQAGGNSQASESRQHGGNGQDGQKDKKTQAGQSESFNGSLSEVERQGLENLKKSIHSLFEFIKVKGDDVYVRDVFTGLKHVIKKSPIVIGFSKSELFEARLIPSGDSFQFSKAFCFHPPPVTKIILKEVKKVKKMPANEWPAAKEALLVRLFKLRYKHEQYKHLDVREIYSPDSKLKI